MNKQTFAIIGSGRVGLPFGLHVYEKGHDVIFCDTNEEILYSIAAGKMPFKEPRFDSLLRQYSKHNCRVFSTVSSLPVEDIDIFVITVGTPVDQHIETNLSYVFSVVSDLCSCANLNNKTIMLRSTVAPKTTERLNKLIKSKVSDSCKVRLVTCPERLAECKARDELQSLPQLCGVSSDEDFDYLKSLYIFTDPIKLSWVSAELGKIFSNTYRYINFSISNYMMYIASQFGQDIHEIFSAIKKDYPRLNGLNSPGMVSGVCLRKDFGMIAENMFASDLLMSAYRVNEFTPKFIADLVSGCNNIGIYGYTFKAGSDDIRDSLVPKLINYLVKDVPSFIWVYEPNIDISKIDYRVSIAQTLEELFDKNDVIIIASNHWNDSLKNIYSKEAFLRKFPNKRVIDIWNFFGMGLDFTTGENNV